MDIVAKTIEAYDKTVDEYYARTKDWHLDPSAKAQLDEFMSLVRKNGWILDLCCGPGRDARIFSEAGFDVVGIDASPNMLAKARSVAPQANFIQRNLISMALPSAYFDGVWFLGGLVTVPKEYDADIFRTLHSTLVDEGILMFSVQEGTENLVKTGDDGLVKLYARHSEKEISDLLAATGFGIIRTYKPVMQSEYYNQKNWRTYVCRKS